jgi:hypothetical protein
VQANFRDALELELAGAVMLTADETPTELRETGEALLHVYMRQAAPSIQPAAVELPVSGFVGDVPAHGFVDILDVSGAVIDTKSAGKRPGKVSADHRLQITTYTMLAPGASGVGRRDTVTKTKTVQHHQQTFTVSAADRDYAARMYSITFATDMVAAIQEQLSGKLIHIGGKTEGGWCDGITTRTDRDCFKPTTKTWN